MLQRPGFREVDTRDPKGHEQQPDRGASPRCNCPPEVHGRRGYPEVRQRRTKKSLTTETTELTERDLTGSVPKPGSR